MAKIKDIMTRDVVTIQCSDTLQVAAQRMRDRDIGAMPVCQGDSLVGMVTDRDLVVRGAAHGMPPQTSLVSAVMSGEVRWCRETDASEDVMGQMGDAQLRRLPVFDRGGKIVGIVSLGDMATRQSAPTDEALHDISEPAPIA